VEGGRGAYVMVESVGLSELILRGIGLTRRLGQVILPGMPGQAVQVNPTPGFFWAHAQGITIKGAERGLFYPAREGLHSRHSYARDLEQVLEWLKDGRLRTGPLLTHTFPPTRCQEAYHGLQKEKDRFLAALFQWGSCPS